ncbi:MAG: class B sortase, partial [Lachnospiraceae bacterium]|nr:class B sortase [Lachnospiraceae bacterium]
MKKKTKKRIGIAVCAVVMAVAGYNVYTIRQEYAEAGGEYDDIAGSVYLSDEAKEAVPIEEPKEKESDTQFAFEDDGPKYDIGTYPNLVIDHAALKKAQPNYKGWLYVPCLEISYPVVQGPDNDYYLHHTFEETENLAGCIFIHHECNADLSSYNTFI